MGAIADAIVDYAQPLFDQTDGSLEEMNRAMSIAQMCWNFSLLPENRRDAAIEKLKPELKMTDEEFAVFRKDLILPMIQRHCEMFPGLHARPKPAANEARSAPGPTKKHSGSTRNAPCSCGSGRKYKQCCGARK
jgi:uncharacterized protein YecA (UPF0149 family)